jgi:UDP-N-acetyl-D-glucosamine dehydrogenase
MLPIFAAAGLDCGRDVFLAFSPEREDPGRTNYTTTTTPRLVGGVDEAGGSLTERLLRAAGCEVRVVATAEIAEAAKLLENIYRAVNIALVNELKTVFTEMGIDIWAVVEAAASKPFGFQAFYPGPGLGGHCIPIDPFYLTWKAKELGLNTRFIELAGEVNTHMPAWVVERLTGALNERGKALRDAKVLVVGVAYKPNVSDIRESPAAEIIEKLQDRHAQVTYHDPHIPTFPSMRKYRIALESVPLEPRRLAEQDCVLIVTDHANIDWASIAEHAKLVVDTRNALRRAGFSPAGLVSA